MGSVDLGARTVSRKTTIYFIVTALIIVISLVLATSISKLLETKVFAPSLHLGAKILWGILIMEEDYR